MADPRFFKKHPPVAAAELADRIGAKVKTGDADFQIHDVASLSRAEEGDVSFLENEKYLSDLKTSQAGAVIVAPERAADVPDNTVALIADKPYQGFALAAQLFYPEALVCEPVAGLQDQPVHPEAQLEAGVELGQGVVIGAGVHIGSGTKIGANTVIGPGCVIGRDCRIGSNVTIIYALIGDRVIIHANTAIGQDGFGFAPEASGHIKIPQLGRVIIQNDVEIGSGCTIDRGTIPDTVVGEGTKIDNLCQLAHNTTIGRHCFMASQSGMAGSSSIGDYVMIGGKVGIAGHLKVGSQVTIQGGSVVTKDLPDGAHVSGYPARDVGVWRRQQAALSRLLKSDSGKKP
ncbi:MAG: UDP-3-O-(3-hydroxymyristoyl)glucosamine N-acyltransferase [Parvibaculales bacterium]